jgi:DNA polymerase
MTNSWPALAAEIAACTACADLAAARQRVVVGDPVPAGIVLVGEAPGAAEDTAGRPFVGKAGQLLDRTLAEVGLDRSRVAVLNVLKCRPPGNRAPKPEEVARCRPFLERQLALLAPSLVVALGLSAVTWFLGRRVTLAAARGVGQAGGQGATAVRRAAQGATAVRGAGQGVGPGATAGGGTRVHEVEVAGRRLRVLATYHPSAAIRFGPNGAPMAALREDLAYAAKLLG